MIKLNLTLENEIKFYITVKKLQLIFHVLREVMNSIYN